MRFGCLVVAVFLGAVGLFLLPGIALVEIGGDKGDSFGVGLGIAFLVLAFIAVAGTFVHPSWLKGKPAPLDWWPAERQKQFNASFYAMLVLIVVGVLIAIGALPDPLAGGIK